MTRLLLAICFSLLLTSTAAAQFGVGIRDDTPTLTDSQAAVLALLSVSGGNLVLADGACLGTANGTTYCGNLGDDLIITAGATTSVQTLVPTGESVVDKVNSVAEATVSGGGLVIADAWTANSGAHSLTSTGLLRVAGASDAAGTGPLDMPEGGTVPTGKSLATPKVEGIAGENFYLIAASGKDIHLQEHADEGGSTRMWVDTGGRTTISDSAGTGQIRVGTTGVDAAAAAPVTFAQGIHNADGKTISTKSLTLRGIDAPPTDPADGDIVLWVANDAAAVGNDTLYITDQASTDAAVTHDVIDVEAP